MKRAFVSLVAAAVVCAPSRGAFARASSELASPAVRALPAAPSASAEDAPRELAFRVAPGTKLARRLSIAHDMQLGSLVAHTGRGEPQRTAPDLAIVTKLELELDDDVLAVAERRPERLRRSFAKGLFHVELGPRAAAKKAAYDVRTPLESNSVVYTWVPEESGYGRYYDAREDVEEHLAGLRQDVDQLALLPAAPVRAGDAWAVPAERLADLFAPCGRLPYAWPKELDRAMVRTLSSGIGGGLSEVFGGTAKGAAKAVLARIERQGEVELAIVTLEFDLDLERDQADVLRQRGSLDEAQGSAGAAHVRWRFRGTGELAWNLGAGRAERLRIEGDETVSARIQLDKAGSVRQELELTGRLVIENGLR
ncbi:MAG: hypothetical protein IPJ77_13475 [Planctomycetes bacterium]|nr:hypothetical protein [Planctomycetota bacterium]